jgi:deoxyribonucleoside regulator
MLLEIDEKLGKIIEAAKLYYLLDYTQSEIAKKMGVSRPTVSRLLQQAKRDGVVQIKINDPTEEVDRLSTELANRFGLKKAIVTSVPEYEEDLIKNYLGGAAAAYLTETVKDEDIIGVTWGTTLYHVALELKQRFVRNVKVVQLKGGVSHAETNTYASEVLYLFAKAFNSISHQLPLPAIVDSAIVKRAMEKDRHISAILDLGKQANIAVFTMGSVKEDALLFKMGYFTESDLKFLKHDAVGDICSRFFDQNGVICNKDLNERTLGIDLEELKTKEHSILVAGGADKINGIYGALAGNYANTLITDQFTARFLLDKLDNSK